MWASVSRWQGLDPGARPPLGSFATKRPDRLRRARPLPCLFPRQLRPHPAPPELPSRIRWTATDPRSGSFPPPSTTSSPRTVRALFAGPDYRVLSAQVDRIGLPPGGAHRFAPPARHRLVTAFRWRGPIQVPGNGQPIVLLRRQGRRRVAIQRSRLVARADRPRLVQRRPRRDGPLPLGGRKETGRPPLGAPSPPQRPIPAPRCAPASRPNTSPPATSSAACGRATRRASDPRRPRPTPLLTSPRARARAGRNGGEQPSPGGDRAVAAGRRRRARSCASGAAATRGRRPPPARPPPSASSRTGR